MKFVIRDDDTSYFTKVSDLEDVYGFIKKGCISLSIVPYTFSKHKECIYPYGEVPNGYYAIGDNTEIIDYISKGVKNGKFDILLHGYTHEYKKVKDCYVPHQRKTPDGIWYPEMIWKPKKQLEVEIFRGKEYLEKIFGTRINCFVAPNNMINKYGIKILEENSLNYSGVLHFNDRPFTICYFYNFFKRWFFRLFYGIQIPKIIRFERHMELVAYPLDSFEKLKKEYLICKKFNTPFVIYTHYWNLKQNREAKKLLKDVYDFVIADGAELVSLSSCFKEKEGIWKN